MEKAKVSFPGLGIGEFGLNSVAIEIGPLKVYWYGILICIGIVLGFAYAYFRMKKHGVTLDDIADIALVSVPCAIIGARLYYVLAKRETFHSFVEVIAIWNGGLAIYGGVIGGVLAFYFVCKKKGLRPLLMCDCAAPGLLIGQMIGRWGNFFNAEAYGVSYSYDFFGKTFDISRFTEKWPLRMTIDGMTVHPTFLYECLWNLLGFVLINIFFNKKKFNGEILLWYLSWYGLGRCFIEGLRGDSLYLGDIRVSQLLALVCFAGGVISVMAIRLKIKFDGRKNKNGKVN